MTKPTTKQQRREWVIDQMLALSEYSSVAPREWEMAYRAVCRAWRIDK